MNKHTPTPWRADEDNGTDILDKDGFCIVSGEEPFAILHRYAEKLNISHWADSAAASREISEEESRANIAHIVRCVNSHEALVLERDALSAKVEVLELELSTQKYFGDLWYFVMDEFPLEFEKIVSEYPPAQWLHQAVQLRNAKKAAAGAPQ